LKIKKLIAWAVLAGAPLISPIVQAQTDLRLYGLPLNTATVTEFIAAANSAGVEGPTSEPGEATTLNFDASRAGVPALARFQLLRQGEAIVSVQFEVGNAVSANESLRKMLVAKYGMPVIAGAFAARGGFDDKYFGGRAHWSFAGGMRLVYNRPHIGVTHLTYVHEPRFQALMDAAKAQADEAARRKAKSLGDKF